MNSYKTMCSLRELIMISQYCNTDNTNRGIPQSSNAIGSVTVSCLRCGNVNRESGFVPYFGGAYLEVSCRSQCSVDSWVFSVYIDNHLFVSPLRTEMNYFISRFFIDTSA